MPSKPFRCNSPEVCHRLAQDILALGPRCGRVEYAEDATLQRLAALYAEERGAEFLAKLEEYVQELSQLYALTPFPSLAQIQGAIDQAYAGGQDEDLQRLLRAFHFYWMARPEALGAALNGLAGRVCKDLGPGSTTSFCGGCGAGDRGGPGTCPRCGSGMVRLSCYEVPALVQRGLQLHVPWELYGASALEEAGFHLPPVERGGHESRISLTFNAFGVTVDVDAIGIGHPPCVVFLSMTTSRVDQGRAMKIKGALDSLGKMVADRVRDKVPLHSVLATTNAVDGNLDVIGMDRAGMTLLGPREMRGLAVELAKIPPRLSAPES